MKGAVCLREMRATILHCLALLAVWALPIQGSDQLPIAFCTPENSQCLLASDGKPGTCFTAAGLEENFYFAVFNTLGQPVTVDKVVLRVGNKRDTKLAVSVGTGSEPHDLACTDQGGDPKVLECPVALTNVTSLMIRSQPLLTRLNLLEVEALSADGVVRFPFSYCVAPEAPSCQEAMDNQTSRGSPAVLSESASFPSWYGGLTNPQPVRTVRIYRPAADAKATFFRVHAAQDCHPVVRGKDGDQQQKPEKEPGVEVLDFGCTGDPANLVQVWEVNADYLISLCEIQVFGQ